MRSHKFFRWHRHLDCEISEKGRKAWRPTSSARRRPAGTRKWPKQPGIWLCGAVCCHNSSGGLLPDMSWLAAGRCLEACDMGGTACSSSSYITRCLLWGTAYTAAAGDHAAGDSVFLRFQQPCFAQIVCTYFRRTKLPSEHAPRCLLE